MNGYSNIAELYAGEPPPSRRALIGSILLIGGIELTKLGVKASTKVAGTAVMVAANPEVITDPMKKVATSLMLSPFDVANFLITYPGDGEFPTPFDMIDEMLQTSAEDNVDMLWERVV